MIFVNCDYVSVFYLFEVLQLFLRYLTLFFYALPHALKLRLPHIYGSFGPFATHRDYEAAISCNNIIITLRLSIISIALLRVTIEFCKRICAGNFLYKNDGPPGKAFEILQFCTFSLEMCGYSVRLLMMCSN